jgi:predicted AAA+ superfamily ATPase
MKVNRLVKPIKSKSFFLSGARGVGKTTFLKAHFEKVEILHFDLLDPEKEDLYSTKP